MPYEYETTKFWTELINFPLEKRPNLLASEKSRLVEFIKDDENAFSVWQAFFSAGVQVDTVLFEWLLSLRPEVASMHCPYSILHEERRFISCTLLHLMLIIKPCHEYLDLMENMVQVCDADGNSSAFYAALADKFEIYERVWKLVGGDGRTFRRPGPQSAAELVRAGWPHIKRNQIHVPQLIESLGGLRPAMKFAIKEKSHDFANELLKKLKDDDWNEFIHIVMNESFVQFNTFLAVYEEAIRQEKDLKAKPQEILCRAYALCHKDSHYKQFLRLVESVKRNFALEESLDELVAFTGSPYLLLYYVYKYPTTMNTVNKTSSNTPPPPEVFDMRSKVLGSYLHVICKRIGSFEPYQRGWSLHCCSLDVWYIPHLLQVTKDEHWTVVDADGNKPIKYLGAAINYISADQVIEMRRRTDSDKIYVKPESAKPKNEFCCTS